LRRFLPGGDALILVALLALFAGLSYGIASQSEPPSGTAGTEHRSTFSTDSGGWKALYQLLEARQNKVVRFRRRPKEWPFRAGVVVTGPYSVGGAAGQWSRAEAKDALAWVAKGGALIAFTDAADDLTESLGVRTSEKAPLKLFGQSGSASKKPADSPDHDDLPSLTARPYRARSGSTPLAVQQPALFLEGVSTLNVPGAKRFTAAPAGSVPLVGDRLPVALAIPYGDGVIIAVSDAGIPDNSHLATADNARFVAQMVEFYASKQFPVILFDEYHQGYREANFFWTAIGRPGQLAFWQMAGLFLLMAYSASRRFGLPRPLAAPSRVSSEYVASLADLYRRARATDAALEAVLKIFWRDLCRSVDMPVDADLSEVALRAAGQASASTEAERASLAERIVRTLKECREKIDVPATSASDENSGRKKQKTKRKPTLSDTELLRLVTTLEGLRKELELGGRNHI
jgi:hypothetical protein